MKVKYIRKPSRYEKLADWHEWFAWSPVIATSSDGEYRVWLLKVLRKGIFNDDPDLIWGGWNWKYKIIEKK